MEYEACQTSNMKIEYIFRKSPGPGLNGRQHALSLLNEDGSVFHTHSLYLDEADRDNDDLSPNDVRLLIAKLNASLKRMKEEVV